MTSNPDFKPVEILLFGTDPVRTAQTINVLKKGKLMNNVVVLNDSEEALKAFRREAQYAGSAPELILFDTALPAQIAADALQAINDTNGVNRAPLVFVGEGKIENHVRELFNQHTNAYVTSIDNLSEFISMVVSFEDFWISIVRR